jgi:acid phosphatase type 7
MSTITMRGLLKAALVLCVLAAFWNGACTEVSSPPKANLQVSPGTVSFRDTIGNASPPPQSVAISADREGAVTGLQATVSYGAGASGWLTVSLSDTVAPATMTLTSNITGLSASTYDATIAIAANDAANSPLTIPVRFEVALPPPVRIVATPDSVLFSDSMTTPSPPPQTVSITADGILPLTGLSASIEYASGAAGWLTASLSGTTAPATLTLTANNNGLNEATYRATVKVTSPEAGNSPFSIPITFELAPPPPVEGITVVALGNMGRCGGELGRESAKVVAAANPDYILMLGNNAMPQAGKVTTLQDYMDCYDPVWGQWKSKTYAVLGDKEVDIDTIPPNYGTGMASGADAYFGPERIGPPGKNWYSFDIGGWHVIALNAQSPGGYKRPKAIQFNASSEQFSWLSRDLRNHSNKCTLAFWYQAMWISSTRPETPIKDGYRVQDIRGLWTLLYQNGADVVLNGTPHIYERFTPMFYANSYQDPTPSEYAADPVKGIRQITSGLAGDGPIHADSALILHPLSAFRSGGNGAVKLVLGDGEYSWEFLNTKYSNIQDRGRGVCH